MDPAEPGGLLQPRAQDHAAGVCLGQRIRISPTTGGVARCVEYGLDPYTGKLIDVEIVRETDPEHEGSTRTWRANHIDLSVPHRLKSYDKGGTKLLIEAVKPVLFPGVRRLTREMLEAFFADRGNFVEEADVDPLGLRL